MRFKQKALLAQFRCCLKKKYNLVLLSVRKKKVQLPENFNVIIFFVDKPTHMKSMFFLFEQYIYTNT